MIRVLAMLFGLLSFALMAVALLMLGLGWLSDRWRRYRDVPRAVDITGKPFPDIRYQRDEGDETDARKDIATEGLGATESLGSFVKDGRLLAIGALHPNDRAIFTIAQGTR